MAPKMPTRTMPARQGRATPSNPRSAPKHAISKPVRKSKKSSQAKKPKPKAPTYGAPLDWTDTEMKRLDMIFAEVDKPTGPLDDGDPSPTPVPTSAYGRGNNADDWSGDALSVAPGCTGMERLARQLASHRTAQLDADALAGILEGVYFPTTGPTTNGVTLRIESVNHRLPGRVFDAHDFMPYMLRKQMINGSWKNFHVKREPADDTDEVEEGSGDDGADDTGGGSDSSDAGGGGDNDGADNAGNGADNAGHGSSSSGDGAAPCTPTKARGSSSGDGGNGADNAGNGPDNAGHGSSSSGGGAAPYTPTKVGDTIVVSIIEPWSTLRPLDVPCMALVDLRHNIIMPRLSSMSEREQTKYIQRVRSHDLDAMLEEPYIAAVLLALAQARRATMLENNKQLAHYETTKAAVILTDCASSEELYVFKARMPYPYLCRFDDGSDGCRALASPPVHIERHVVPFRPFATIRDRLLAILESTLPRPPARVYPGQEDF